MGHMEIGDQPTQSSRREIILKELRKETSERVGRIDREFADGFELINKYNDTITFFGSARFTTHYNQAEKVAAALSKEGYAIVSGGGGGIMEAADRGAKEVGGEAIGLNISLPKEQGLNPYTTESMAFRYFFVRKVMLVFGASAYVFFP